MGFKECFRKHGIILMEGALGERLKREFHLQFDDQLVMAKLIYEPKGREALRTLWRQYITIAEERQLPFLATTPTRRANIERIKKAGSSDKILIDNMEVLLEMKQHCKTEMYAGGLLGCKGDAYTGRGVLTTEEARAFHRWQATCLKEAGAEFLYAGIMPALPEAVGMAQALSDTGLPYLISFTIKRDGRLIDGTSIADAIERIDKSTEYHPVCYMTNCVHPSILDQALKRPFNDKQLVRERFLGIQANTSPLSYEELDGSLKLYCSTPETFAREMIRLQREYHLKILGGCCGTDNRHMEAVASRL